MGYLHEIQGGYGRIHIPVGSFQESGLPVSAHWKWSPYFACTSL